MTLEDFLRETTLHDAGVERLRRRGSVLELDVELDAGEGGTHRLRLETASLTAEPSWSIFDWPAGVDGEILRFDSTRHADHEDFEVVVLIHRYDGGQSDVGVVRGRCEALTLQRVDPAG